MYEKYNKFKTTPLLFSENFVKQNKGKCYCYFSSASFHKAGTIQYNLKLKSDCE